MKEYIDSFGIIFMLIGPKNVIENLYDNKYIKIQIWDLVSKEIVDNVKFENCTP